MTQGRNHTLSVGQRITRLFEIFAASGGGAIAGALLTLLFDPDRGHARRARLRDETLAAMRRAGRQSRRAANKEIHHATDRLRGAAHVSVRRLRVRHDDRMNDATLAQKVRSEALGPLHRSFVSVDAANGTVWLRGELDSMEEIERLGEAAREVRGVRRVVNLLHLPGEQPANKRAVLRLGDG